MSKHVKVGKFIASRRGLFISIIAKLIHREPCVFCSAVTQLKKDCELCLVHFFKKPFGIRKPQFSSLSF